MVGLACVGWRSLLCGDGAHRHHRHNTSLLSSILIPSMLTHWVRTRNTPGHHGENLMLSFQVWVILTLGCSQIVCDVLPRNPHLDTEDTAEDRRGRILDNLIDFSSAVLDEETGLKCVRTEETLETLEREKLLSCTHSSINICHYTYVTKFSPFQPRVCEDVYSKQCNIVFSRRAEETTEQHCYRPWTRRCGLQGEEGEGGEETQCRRVSDSWCVTRWQAGKGTALTSCNKIPQTLCSPANCQIVQVTTGRRPSDNSSLIFCQVPERITTNITNNYHSNYIRHLLEDLSVFSMI